ncbi:hypothetical protein [Chitinophaga nivalis]|uniref:ScyD/ScyE family protein n=1 Tax=Chitinophaga nivalis TaxID=2991709 RepID=A0ABT3IG62_9BACT|nr:hypothetical protein [Chitinophaga nivalis]MCW3467351.1 hypothetical protein [Chitinophaga nivalis]MCW3482957.1 hypothetical protein [Chitinophaga nivalis]
MKQFIKILLCALFLLNACYTFAQQPLNRTAFLHAPESIVESGRHYYISDLGAGGNPTKKDTNGIIWQMDKKGNGTVFVQGLDAPKGLLIHGQQLFVTDIDQVKSFPLAGKQPGYRIDLSQYSHFLNDIARIDDSTLAISATDVHKIILVHLGKHPRAEVLPLNQPITGANGLIYDPAHKRLYACGFGNLEQPDGEIGYIDMQATEKVFTPVTSRRGHYDGIALVDGYTKLLVSDWVAFEKKGVLLSIDPGTGTTTTINKAPIAGPADFMVDHAGNIITPAMMEGNILKFVK